MARTRLLIVLSLLGATFVAGNNNNTQVGVYHWGGQNKMSMADGVQQVVRSGGHTVRLAISGRSAIDYNGYGACSEATSLIDLIRHSDIEAALDNAGIDVFMLTTYDTTSFRDCATPRYLNPRFFTEDTKKAIAGEYRDLTFYLHQRYSGTQKRFIISNWESDNAIYCGQAFNYTKSEVFRSWCNSTYSRLYDGNASPAESLEGLKLWFAIRRDGIEQGRKLAAEAGLGGSRVYFAPEICIVRALKDAGLPSVLYNVLPFVVADYVSYSAYESIYETDPETTLARDLNEIRNVAGPASIILGEIGYSRAAWGGDVVKRTDVVIQYALSAGVSYIFIWNLCDQDPANNFGLIDGSGAPTAMRAYFEDLMRASR